MPKATQKKGGSKPRIDECLNPKNIPRHKSKSRGKVLRKISEKLLTAYKLPINDEYLQMMICNSCRIGAPKPPSSNEIVNAGPDDAYQEVAASENRVSSTEESSEEQVKNSDLSDLSEETNSALNAEKVADLNKGLDLVEVSPIKIEKN